MAEAIRACLTGGPAEPSGVEPSGEDVGDVRRRRAIWLASAAALLGAAAVTGWAIWPRREAGPLHSAAELREILSAAGVTGLPDGAVLNYRRDPRLRRIVGLQRMRRGQFSRTVPDLEGYDRLICEIASAGALQRFVSPGLFRLWIREPQGLQGHEIFLAAAFSRHQENRRDAAEEKLRAAAAGSPPSHVLLVRAHMVLWEVFPDPAGEESKPLLGALRAELERSEETHLLPLRSLAAHLDGDGRAAWAAADALRDRAPHAAETWILRSILFQREGRIDLARDALGDAARLEPERLETTLHGHFLRLIEVLNDPEGSISTRPWPRRFRSRGWGCPRTSAGRCSWRTAGGWPASWRRIPPRRSATAGPEALEGRLVRSHGVLSSVVRHETAERLEISIGRLSTPMREAFILRYVDGMDYSEIAQITGVSEGTARVRAFRARALLREELGAVVDSVWLRKD